MLTVLELVWTNLDALFTTHSPDHTRQNYKTMKWRVIIRISFNDDKESKLRYRLAEYLGACDIKFLRKSSTWEGPAVSPEACAKQLQSVFTLLSNPQAAGIRRANLDHLWIYIDQAA